MKTNTIEDYPQGYPRFSALVGASDQFHICRRFSNLRSRLLLVKQDKLSLLESQLENVDREEESVLFLGSNRVDKNDERLSLLSQIEDALTDYDALVERNFRTFRYEPAKPRDILSLQNWINGNSCIARAESAYLDKEKDLVGVSPSLDGAATGLEVWIEDWLVRFHKLFRKQRYGDVSNDPKVFIFEHPFISRIARSVIASLTILIILVPAVLCLVLTSVTARVVTIVLGVGCFITTLAVFTRAKPLEIAVAGATYTAVLFVFISKS